jgi:glycerophosphoryl diester phosphodiesterase
MRKRIAAVLAPRPRGLVRAAHDVDLLVHAWTLRKENAFLPPMLRRGEDPAATGDYAGLRRLLAAAGVDGVFTDNPREAGQAR